MFFVIERANQIPSAVKTDELYGILHLNNVLVYSHNFIQSEYYALCFLFIASTKCFKRKSQIPWTVKYAQG